MKPLIPWFEAPVIHIPLGGDNELPLHGFGLLVAIGFVLGGKQSMARARRQGLDPELINQLIGWLVFGTFVGGHVGYGLMYKPEEYLANPIEFLKFWQGLSSFGGFAVCVPISIWFFWSRGVKDKIWAYLDCLAYGFALGWFFGRMGCFVAHDHPGTPTDFWLGVYGICQPDLGKNVACHDMGLYEGLFSLGLFGLFFALDRRQLVPGVLVLLIGLLYAPVRFGMDFLRPETTDRTWALVPGLDLTAGQWWSAVLFVVCVAALVVRIRTASSPGAAS